MQKPQQSSPGKATYRSSTPPLDSSSEELDLSIDYDSEELEKMSEQPRKPHFLDYDYIPPPGCDDIIPSNDSSKKSQKNHSGSPQRSSENVKVDKKYERDGEISDSVLAQKREKLGKSFATGSSASGEITSNKTVAYRNFIPDSDGTNTGARKKKYPVEEASVPVVSPYNREREHRSLDRNFERFNETNVNLKYERKLSLERERPSAFALPKFIERDVSPVYSRSTWPSDKPSDLFSYIPSDNVLRLGPKVDCVYSLLSMLGSKDSNETSIKFLEMSKIPESCIALRRSGCILLLVQMMHSDSDENARKRAGLALHNIIQRNTDDKVGRREAKVFRLIEHVMDYNDFLRNVIKVGESPCDDVDQHPSEAITSLMKISYDQDHRHTMCQLGALQAIANLVYLDHAAHGNNSQEIQCITLRRYSTMTLINLTFGDGNNKALLCSNINFMKALVNQLNTSPEELIQVTAGVLRNLSWRVDDKMKLILSDIGTVTALAKAAMKNSNESTLKSIMSALWNLTAHSSMNKAEFCSVEGALGFLADMLTFEGSGKSLTIIENAGGILRNVSSHIAVSEDYRKILRQRNCLGILLQQLKSESLTVVSNACGTLWNLSARCPTDQKYLCDNGAIPMLRSLVHSKHKMISNGSNVALKNLLNYAKPTGLNLNPLDPVAKSMNLKELPSLNVRKQRALQEDLDQNLSETCENIEIVTPPKEERNVQDFCDPHYHKPIVYPNRRDESVEPIATSSSCKIETTKSVKSESEKVDSFTGVEDCDQITDFSAKYNRELEPPATENSGVYQETDLDQITDYSIRYGEKHSETEEKRNSTTGAQNYNGEIVLPLEDTIKCYETEGTPYVISSATSLTDLRLKDSEKTQANEKTKSKNSSNIHTPEKPISYCDEGTPGYFSRRDSISSIEELGAAKPPEKFRASIPVNIPESEEPETNEILATTPGGSASTKNVTFVESEQQTPLMFSRHSSVESLSSAEHDCADDRSSVVSDFSRLASGLISPSELPDSPTQSMPQTPRTSSANMNINRNPSAPPRLRSVFEDEVNSFGGGVEHTPAQFSCATSLSNLSLDDEPKISSDNLTKDMRLITHPSEDQDDTVQIEVTSDSPKETTRTIVPTSNISNASVASITKLNTNDPYSDVEENNDDILLATCINIGMNRSGRPKPIIGPSTDASAFSFPTDNIMKFCTEGTPALMSKAGSNSNLSILSIETNKNDLLSDDSSNNSDSNEQLLEECIRDGMKKSQSREFNVNVKENPISMMRTNSTLAPYLLIKDEINKFNVEDSPCNFSTMSALSNLTIDSEGGATGGFASQERTGGVGAVAQPEKPTFKPSAKTNRFQSDRVVPTSHDDSLSSLSIDSEDDNNLLSQAIAAGFESKPKNKNTSDVILPQTTSSSLTASNQATSKHSIPALFSTLDQRSRSAYSNQDVNDSYSSIESTESSDIQQQFLLEQCIHSGMHKEPIKSPPKSSPGLTTERKTKPSSLQKKSSLPTYKTPSVLERDRIKERERKDTQLLFECISTGISKSIKNDAQSENVNSKNGETTSVVVSDLRSAPSTATDVGKELRDGTKEFDENHSSLDTISTKLNGYNNEQESHNLLFNTSHSSINQFLNSSDNILERSNEFPALNNSNMNFTAESSLQNSTTDMDGSNEFLYENSELSGNRLSKVDKHKDPDLMLKSVERLTHELVTTAEYLRTNNSTFDEKKSSSSNNTWNEDTCPNDVSFPSISMTAPMIASMNDDTTVSDTHPSKGWIFEEETPTNENKKFSTPNENLTHKVSIHEVIHDSLLDKTLSLDYAKDSIDGNTNEYDSLEPESKTLTTEYQDNKIFSGIHFDVGGEVKLVPKTSAVYPTNSLMTNSMVIAFEADKIADVLKNFQMTESTTSLDLDNIRPPSAMDNLSISGYFESTSMGGSPQLSRTRKKSLPAGLLARRAIAHGHCQNNTGSMESINSTCNLENIKPPSIMDDLLDSMISVASITSEIADNSILDGTSHYDTALSDIDDTITLQSCFDFPNDGTPTQSDFSSAESTPKKSRSMKRSLTPKQKRQMVKERYRTYTIAADMVLKEKAEEIRIDLQKKFEMEEEIVMETNEEKQKVTPRQRRQENRSRFQTQTLDSSGVGSSSSIEINLKGDINYDEDDDDDVSLKAFTEKFKFINENILVTSTHALPEMKVLQTVIGKCSESDIASLDYEQNSETESCDQNAGQSDGSGDFRTFTKISPRIIKPDVNPVITPPASPEIKAVRGGKKAAYVSPYRRTISNKATSEKTSSPATSRANLATKISNETKKLHVKSTPTANLVPHNQTIVSKTHVIINKSNLSNKINAIKTKITSSSSTTAKQSTTLQKTEMPARQGTFVKEEPTNDYVPVVSSIPSSPSKSSKLPSRIQSSKITSPKTIISKLKMPLQKSASMDSGKILSAHQQSSNSSKSSTPTSASAELTKRRSMSVFKSPSVSNVPQRSSNPNLSTRTPLPRKSVPSSNPPSRSNSTVTKSNITSKIVGLWKKTPTDDSKKDVKKPSSAMQSSKLIRSSTFDNSPPKSTASKSIASTKSTTLVKKGSMGRIPMKSPSINNLKKETKTDAQTKRISRTGTFINVEEDGGVSKQTIKLT